MSDSVARFSPPTRDSSTASPDADEAARVPYRAPVWLPGGHAQTLYAALLAPCPRLRFTRSRWETPDGDFVDLDWVKQDSGFGIQDPELETRDPELETWNSELETQAPLVVLFHGLEGGSRSHYACALMAALAARGWRGVVPHFRGCSGEVNRLPRAYHSGDSAEIDWIVRRLKDRYPATPVYAVGVSLGGNALLKWLGESGASARGVVDRAVSVSAPLDLMIAGDALGRGFNLVYARYFLRTMKKKSLMKLDRFPG
ncbi:MAG: alpha/beta fold hydrolase, partial [Betaproteobacteria bacterium]|nr:alpha/beta fold hydrolase [Betaproteobacteria bacterium]